MCPTVSLHLGYVSDDGMFLRPEAANACEGRAYQARPPGGEREAGWQYTPEMMQGSAAVTKVVGSSAGGEEAAEELLSLYRVLIFGPGLGT